MSAQGKAPDDLTHYMQATSRLKAREAELLGKLNEAIVGLRMAGAALVDASVALDDDGSQLAASDAHQAHHRVIRLLDKIDREESTS